MTLIWDYLLVVKVKIHQSNVKIKVEIKVDQNNTEINVGKVFVFDENSKKFNKLYEMHIRALFGGESPPKGIRDDGLLNSIVEASDKLIESAIKILQ